MYLLLIKFQIESLPNQEAFHAYHLGTVNKGSFY